MASILRAIYCSWSHRGGAHGHKRASRTSSFPPAYDSLSKVFSTSFERFIICVDMMSTKTAERLQAIAPVGKRTMKVIQPVPVPKGTYDFERQREKLLQELADSIPQEYYLPHDILDNPPEDVTGIPATCGILTEEEVRITEDHDATSLAEIIAQKRYTAVAVATAFAKRAAIAHQLTCCLTQYFMDEALERARYLDEYLEKEGRPIGPLHGVPVSVKEHMMLAGHYSSYGYLSTRVYNEKDCLLIKNLRDAGAVFYC